MAQKTVMLGAENAGLSVSDFSFVFKTRNGLKTVPSTGLTLTPFGGGIYVLNNPNVVESTIFRMVKNSDPNTFVVDEFVFPSPIMTLQTLAFDPSFTGLTFTGFTMSFKTKSTLASVSMAGVTINEFGFGIYVLSNPNIVEDTIVEIYPNSDPTAIIVTEMTAQAVTFTSLANVKAWMKITNSDSDVVLSRLIAAITAFFNTYLSRNLLSSVYNESYNGRGNTSLGLRNYPVSAVAGVTVDNKVIPPAVDQVGPGYVFDDTHIYLRCYEFCRGKQNISIQYTAGLQSVPLDIEQAAIETIALRYKESDRIGHNSKSISGEVISFTITDFPKDVQTLLKQYRRTVPII